MICPNCLSDFIPPRKDALYCGKRCRDSAYKKRKIEKAGRKLKGIDLTGMRFGRLLVLERTNERSNTFVVYLCVCDCGKQKKATTGALRSGNTRSCGCLEIENRKRINSNFSEASRKHSGWGTATYSSWSRMKDRCSNHENKDYGGRGIKICEEWINSFDAFLRDMGKRPYGHSIDRIDVNGDYCKENCRWSIPKVQCRNRTNNVYVLYEGREITVAEFAEIHSMSWSGAEKKSKRLGIYIGRR